MTRGTSVFVKRKINSDFGHLVALNLCLFYKQSYVLFFGPFTVRDINLPDIVALFFYRFHIAAFAAEGF